MLRLPRQRVNYHVRELFRGGFLRRAGRRRKRNMIEQRYVASAPGYLISPDVLGTALLRPAAVEDTASAAYLLAVLVRSQSELARATREASAQGRRLPSLSIAAEVRFLGPRQREAFTRALHAAVLRVVARHSAPARAPGGRPGPGRPYRLVVACHPVPPEPALAGKED